MLQSARNNRTEHTSSELDDLPLAHDRSPPPRITQPDCSHLLCDQILCNSPQLKQTQGPQPAEDEIMHLSSSGLIRVWRMPRLGRPRFESSV